MPTMLTAKQLRQIRRQSFRSNYEFDDKLINKAKNHPHAGIYQTIINPASHLVYRYLSEFVAEVMLKQTDQLPKSIKILDWGGGKGYVTYFLYKAGFDAVCYETDDFGHRAIWEAFHLPTKTGKGISLPFKDETFDAVISFGVLEHVPYDYESLKEINRVLKPNGLFFCLNLPNKYGYMHQVAQRRGLNYHDRLYSWREARYLLKRAGMNPVGRPWRRQLFPKNAITYKHPRQLESLDLKLTRYTPLGYLATSLEFVARKQYAYLSDH